MTDRGARLASASLAISVVVAFLVTLLGSSTKNTVQVFFVPMAESFGQSRGSFALATTVFAVTYAVAAPLTGALADRIGPERVLLLGSVLGGVSFLVCSNVDVFVVFVATYGLLASVATTMLSYVPIGVLVDRLFPEGRKGFFYALLTNGTAAGFILLVPLWTWLGRHLAWQSILNGLGLFLLVVVAPLTLLLAPDRDARTAAEQDATAGGPRRSTPNILRSSVFWRLALAFGSCGATMAFIDVHLMPHLGDMHVHPSVSSSTMVALGFFEIVGALVAGRLCDRGFLRRVLIGGYVMRASAMFLLAALPADAGLIVFSVIFGTSFMVTVVGTSLWVLRIFPVQVKGMAMGLIWMVHQIGAALVSQVGALIYDHTDSYVPTLVASGALAVVGAFLIATLASPDAAPSHHDQPDRAEVTT